MPASVHLVVIDPVACAVVEERWIGGDLTRDVIPSVLQRLPDHTHAGYASWGRVTVAEASRISETHYVDGITPDEVAQLAVVFPDERYWWTVYVDY